MRTHGLRFDVNCSILFTELPLPRRSAAAKAARCDAVEFWRPFEDMVPSDTDADNFIAAQGYAGSVGLEYVPLEAADSSTSFGWL